MQLDEDLVGFDFDKELKALFIKELRLIKYHNYHLMESLSQAQLLVQNFIKKYK
jgi:hypothetical protein